ncbi:MAG: Single-stranded nucleic acid binding R3H domain protein [Candidatus Jorgensenbacteria bacterium GW2011_GWA1_48_13]|uniref:Single-stranded nucleic acid binding R3H domain protein n=2 Tax=Candidatus Joergenseniibacteriota TaxID=1752739 RepID=A0A0G1W925_9BACT|nr:MAG: Single-stranded nucleic acid binding R3H domain protein [Candidatus Jorgensenbacteria bacterium GW2011_GWA1_48_13]KKU99064.1 MAG: Single-stranded nucleic acid binding R3H domain protein [Candidatus Jorgensenbacteria bacterium GW2011_GWC1_48_8]KKW15296.1 MAG: Single-stranded nucleic acid binding R3H domain protein [Candidatus Jorgensenbacteria bacterium GW2011_GWB1_50_10]
MTEDLIQKTKKIVALMGFEEPRVELDEEHRKISLFIDDDLIQTRTATVLPAMEHLLNLMVKDENRSPYVVDLNYYRKERERLISELARAAAHKAMLTKTDVELPPMNAYERRLVHLEITTHPELKTESFGTGRERRVVIKHLSTGSL